MTANCGCCAPARLQLAGRSPDAGPDPDAIAYVRLTGSPVRRRFVQAISGAAGSWSTRLERLRARRRQDRPPGRVRVGASCHDAHRLGPVQAEES